MEQLQQAYPARTATRTYSLIQRMQDKVKCTCQYGMRLKSVLANEQLSFSLAIQAFPMPQAAELEQQSEIASAGTLHSSGSSAAQDALKSTSLARQPTRAPRSFMFSSTDNAAGVHVHLSFTSFRLRCLCIRGYATLNSTAIQQCHTLLVLQT